MKRNRTNRRKRAPRALPKLPTVRINWRALLLGPAIVAVVLVLSGFGKALLDRPVSGLTIEGTFQRVTPIQIEQALGELESRRYFSLDLAALRDAVARIDWVDTVEIRREWPGSLRVTITEHEAAASWGAHGLLNTRGELFTEDARHEYAELPKLSGPPGTEHAIASLYLSVRSRLAQSNLLLVSLRMDDRGALRIGLAGGQEIRLGRQDIEERLDRFFAVAAPALADRLDRVRHVDLRYPNGFAVAWHDDPAGDGQSDRTLEVTQLEESDGRG